MKAALGWMVLGALTACVLALAVLGLIPGYAWGFMAGLFVGAAGVVVAAHPRW